MRHVRMFAAAAVCVFPTLVSGQTTVALSASKDNTIYNDDSAALANGQGPALIAGKPDFVGVRRALIAFDLAAIPTGATVTAATLALAITREPPEAPTVSAAIHRVTSAWGEGASNDQGPGGAGAFAAPGDATWQYRLFETDLWTTPGGDFAAAASSAATIAPGQLIAAWGGAGVAADVQGWLTAPATNQGWIILISEDVIKSARRFGSREAEAGLQPVLTVTYTEPGGGCVADFNDDGDVNGDDLADYINCFFSSPPCDGADVNADGDVNGDDLADFINVFFAGC